ncbi:MAG: adenylate/guanylate cyclase domain-containing protein [Acidimicrobiia bacterium]
MAKLNAQQRAKLPDRAFAYVDSNGKRRLPIHDEAHVRNALARFNQVHFESPEAREVAFRRLLKAALGFGIAPIGFVASQMREARSGVRSDLPTGPVTFMMIDIEGSTGLADRLGTGYPALLDSIWELIRGAVDAAGGYEVDARGDEFFAVFSTAVEAVESAVAVQRSMGGGSWPAPVRVRIGLHCGTPARTETGYVGLDVNAASRVCFAGHGGQVVASEIVRRQAGKDTPAWASFRPLGVYTLRGLPEEMELFQIVAPGLDQEFPPPRV